MVNAFSFCIYGPEHPKYHIGLLENIDIASSHFPDWRVFVYVGSETPASYIQKLRGFSNVVLRFTNISGHKNSIHRFFAIDEPDVDLMMVRDADSRVHWKDRWAIRNFLDSGRGVHVIRDHKTHNIPILAGLWGIRRDVLGMRITDLYSAWTPKWAGSGDKDDPEGFGIDQNFLRLEIYERIIDHIHVNYSFNCLYSGEHAEKFPFEWSIDIYCGRREDIFADTSRLVVDRFIPSKPESYKLDFLRKK